MVNTLIIELKDRGYEKNLKDFDAEIIAKCFKKSKMWDETLSLDKLVHRCLTWFIRYELY